MPRVATSSALTIRRVLGSNCCAGCGLCAAVSDGAVEMKVSDQGYLRPYQKKPLTPQIDRLVAEVCPGNQVVQKPRTGENHVLWGPVLVTRTGYAVDKTLRYHASSGGVLSAIATFLIGSGMVDRVVQTGPSATAPVDNVTVISRNGQDVYHAAGSRYAPSSPLEGILDELEKDGSFALVGKPCDIAAMRALALRDKRIRKKIPVMLSFFCAGIPSQKGAHLILKKLGVVEQDVARFRYRGDGWPGRATAILNDGTEVSMSYSDSWGDILSKHVQFRCKICPDGSGGQADIVCADAWHSDKSGYPLFEEKDGRSLIVTRTKLGEMLVLAALKEDKIAAEPQLTEEIARMQPSQANRKRLIASRLLAMILLGKHTPLYRGFDLLLAARTAGFGANIKSFLGLGRRILTKRW